MRYDITPLQHLHALRSSRPLRCKLQGADTMSREAFDIEAALDKCHKGTAWQRDLIRAQLIAAQADGIRRWVSNYQPCDASNETYLWRCTACGRIGTVGRCCGEDTREPVQAPNVGAKPKTTAEGEAG